MGSRADMTCRVCGAVADLADNFCEACGSSLADLVAEPEVTACGSCGSGEIDPDGYCDQCGQKAPSTRDHASMDLGPIAAVTDRGRRHHRNEDAMALALVPTPAGPVSVAAVCDGVSTSDRPDVAASTAAGKVLDVLTTAVRAGVGADDALVMAALAADRAVSDLAGDSANAPATTLVAAVVTAATVTVCWIGDSRAYWLPAEPALAARLLTRDDSLAEELLAAGAMSEADAISPQHEHTLTRWLGADAEKHEPHLAAFAPPGPGILLLCSDGLWNYQPDADHLRRLAMPAALTDLPGAAAAMLAFALEAGGRDNITIVLCAVPLARPETNTPESSSR